LHDLGHAKVMAGPVGFEPMKTSHEDVALENGWATPLWGK
jgi:hypothetical protein